MKVTRIMNYEYMLNALRDPFNFISVIFMFIFGAIFGATLISRFIVFLFANYRSRTLYVLFGFVDPTTSGDIVSIEDTKTAFSTRKRSSSVSVGGGSFLADTGCGCSRMTWNIAINIPETTPERLKGRSRVGLAIPPTQIDKDKL